MHPPSSTDPSRRRFLWGLAATGAAGVVAGCGGEDEPQRPPPPPDPKSDIEILSFALRLERVEAAFYEEVLERNLLDGRARDLVATFHRQEREHVGTLERLISDLGGSPGGELSTEFPMQSRRDALELARRLEDLGADAYLGQLRRLRRDDVLAKVVSIYSVESRHAATLTELTAREYTPGGPFAKPVGMAEALRELDPYIR
jgi:rubrerythrin